MLYNFIQIRRLHRFEMIFVCVLNWNAVENYENIIEKPISISKNIFVLLMNQTKKN